MIDYPSTCPNCGYTTPDARRRARMSAKEQVEALTLDEDMVHWIAALLTPSGSQAVADFVNARNIGTTEMFAFKDRMRANGYRTNAGPVKDAAAAFRTHMRNAVRFAQGKTRVAGPVATPQRAPKKEV